MPPLTQTSCVQALPSEQACPGGSLLATHDPFRQLSGLSQSVSLGLPHGPVLLTCTQPEAGSHESSVQTFPSLQLSGPPGWQVPPPHVSPTVQKFPSLHGAVLFEVTQPAAG